MDAWMDRWIGKGDIEPPNVMKTSTVNAAGVNTSCFLAKDNKGVNEDRIKQIYEYIFCIFWYPNVPS